MFGGRLKYFAKFISESDYMDMLFLVGGPLEKVAEIKRYEGVTFV